jgi:hemerythrin-like domain-containing protein
MSNPEKSIVTASLLNTHKIITRGLSVSIETCRELIKSDFKLDGQREGFFTYVRTLVSTIHAHHLTEDEVAFPYFRDKIPDAPFDMLSQEHQAMVRILDEISAALEKCENDEQFEVNLNALEAALTRLNHLWHAHINVEEDVFTKKAGTVMPAITEQIRLVSLFTEHSQKYSGPAYLAIPFMLYNLPEAERKTFSGDLPIEIVQNLVPKAWKEKWEPMRPFLLV